MDVRLRLKILKVVIAVVWFFIAASVIIPSQAPFPAVFQGIGIFLVVSHLIEIVVYRKRMRSPSDYLLTMLFGALQLKTIRIES